MERIVVLDLVTQKEYYLVEGTYLQDQQVFAGKCARKAYRKAWKYAKRYGGNAWDWQHMKATGLIDTEDGDRKVEIHWSQCEGVGRKEMFIKQWLD